MVTMVENEEEYSELCYECGKIVFPGRKENGKAITLYIGTCPRCKEEKTLIPIADWRNLYWD